MNKAIFIKETKLGKALYKLDPPYFANSTNTSFYNNDFQNVEYVLVSAVHTAYAHETFIFESDDSGSVGDFCELEGSYEGGTDHKKALEGLGYTLVA